MLNANMLNADTLHLLLSGGKLECEQHSYDTKTVEKFNSFLDDRINQNDITQYLIENCRFLDFREIERHVRPIILSVKINLNDSSQQTNQKK